MVNAKVKTTPTPKATATNGAVRKAGRPKGPKPNKARTAMIKMQAYFKENREKYKHLDFKDQQKELGKEWKTSSENPKNQA